MNDHTEVCSLSRQAMFQPVSSPLQKGFRFFRVPLPAAPTTFLAVRLPLLAALRAYPVAHEFLSGADPSFFAGGFLSTMAYGVKPYLAAHLLVQAYRHFWLVKSNDVYRRFTCVGRNRSSLAPLRLGAGRFRFASRLSVPKISAVTLSLKLHTEPLPAPHVQVGNGWWNNRFQLLLPL